MEIISFLVAIAALILVLKILTFPLKVIIKFVINSIIGGVIILVLKFFGIQVLIEWWTIVLTGLFGAPGLVIALIISMFI